MDVFVKLLWYFSTLGLSILFNRYEFVIHPYRFSFGTLKLNLTSMLSKMTLLYVQIWLCTLSKIFLIGLFSGNLYYVHHSSYIFGGFYNFLAYGMCSNICFHCLSTGTSNTIDILSYRSTF